MKKILAAVALSALIASPALAASSRHVRNSAPPTMTNPANNVYLDGEYRGSDPDANVRLELRRDTQIGAGA
jgi:hypothetical protein